jgi:hypothetical protein
MTDVSSAVDTFFTVGTILAIYLFPSILARVRRHKNLLSIVLTNLMFGWTLVGWAVVLIWATTNNVNPAPVPAEGPHSQG